MASVLRISTWTGAANSAGAGASAEGGIKYNRQNSLTGTTPIPIPTATGTAFSWPKFLGLEVTTDGSTAISNRGIKMNSAIATGMHLWFKATATYTTPAAVADTDSASNGATPSGYTEVTTSNQTYHAASVNSNTGTAVNGQYLVTALGVDNLYTGGASSAAAVPTHTVQYDEA